MDEYYRECEEFICKQNLEAHGLVILDVFIGKLNVSVVRFLKRNFVF